MKELYFGDNLDVVKKLLTVGSGCSWWYGVIVFDTEIKNPK